MNDKRGWEKRSRNEQTKQRGLFDSTDVSRFVHSGGRASESSLFPSVTHHHFVHSNLSCTTDASIDIYNTNKHSLTLRPPFIPSALSIRLHRPQRPCLIELHSPHTLARQCSHHKRALARLLGIRLLQSTMIIQNPFQ